VLAQLVRQPITARLKRADDPDGLARLPAQRQPTLEPAVFGVEDGLNPPDRRVQILTVDDRVAASATAKSDRVWRAAVSATLRGLGLGDGTLRRYLCGAQARALLQRIEHAGKLGSRRVASAAADRDRRASARWASPRSAWRSLVRAYRRGPAPARSSARAPADVEQRRIVDAPCRGRARQRAGVELGIVAIADGQVSSSMKAVTSDSIAASPPAEVEIPSISLLIACRRDPGDLDFVLATARRPASALAFAVSDVA
jgi:hypothetical protein